MKTALIAAVLALEALSAPVRSRPWPSIFPRSLFSQSDPYPGLLKTLSADAEIYVPGEDEFHTLTLRWQKYSKPNFAGVVAVGNEEDIITSNNGIEFMAGTSGHGVTAAMGKITNGMQINLRKLNTTKLSDDGSSVFIGGGSLAWEVTEALASLGKRVVVPTGECIGVVSPALAGGHGLLQGQYGLLADQIISARLILANGTVIKVSETSYPDLFWGLKGAGKNFGIVSELEYKVYDIPANDNWIMETITFSNDRLEEVFEFANDLLDIQPAEMVHFVYYNNIPEVDANKPSVQIKMILNGPASTLSKYTAPLHAMGPALNESQTLPWTDASAFLGVKRTDDLCKKLSDTSAAIQFPIDLYKYNTTAMRSIYNILHEGAIAEPKLSGSVMLIEGYSTVAVHKVPKKNSAVAFRDQRLLLSSAVIYTDNGDMGLTSQALAWGNQIRDVLRQGSSPEEQKQPLGYINYALGDQGFEDFESVYGYESWRKEKLESLKMKWDPTNAFGWYGPIPV